MTFSYVVQRGDTLYRIARRYAVSLTALLSANPGLDPNRYLIPGQVIQIPERTAQYYVIQAGDTLFDIARRFNIRLSDVMAANPGINPDRLQIGQTIVLPSGQGQVIVDTSGDYGYQELVADLEALQQAYTVVEVYSIGTSVMGKSIPAIRLGRGTKQVFYNAAFHANEWITTPLLMKFVEDYARAYQQGTQLRGYDVRALYEQTALWIVPMVNPDGVELVLEGMTPGHPYYEQLLEWNHGSYDFRNWKANIRGVDLNDQFPAGWEIERERRSPDGPGPKDYVGTAPLTEPEAVAVAEFTDRHPFRLTISFHTQGEEIYWNYRDLEPPESEGIAQQFARVSGYRPVKLTESDAGYKDWFIQDLRRPGYTVEVGRGVNPLPMSQFPGMYDASVGIMLLGLVV